MPVVGAGLTRLEKMRAAAGREGGARMAQVK